MKRLLLLATAVTAIGVTVAVLPNSHPLFAHNATISCQSDGRVKFSGDTYTQGGVYSVNGGAGVPFASSFSIFLPGNIVERGVITAPDWPKFDQTAGPCVQPTTTTHVTYPATTTTAATTTTVKATTTTEEATTSTSPSTSTTVPESSTSTTGVTTTSGPTSTSTAPPTTGPSSTSSAPSTTAAPTSTTRASTSTVASGVTSPRPPSTSPAVAALPVTGTKSDTAWLAFILIVTGFGLVVAAARRTVKS